MSLNHSIDLSAGVNVITIVVTAEDYETTETYTVRVVRGVSNDATLSSLSLMTMPTEGTGEAIDLKDMDGMTAEFMADIDDVLRRRGRRRGYDRSHGDGDGFGRDRVR